MATGGRKQQTGVVLSNAMDKSITVGVSWSQRDRIYGKSRRRITRLIAHDEANQATNGDTVLIEETRPMSRRKRWRLVQIIEKGDVADLQPEDIGSESADAGAESQA